MLVPATAEVSDVQLDAVKGKRAVTVDPVPQAHVGIGTARRLKDERYTA